MADDLGVHFNPSYLMGVLLAANAIDDAHVMIDGPGCVISKARLIHGAHDLQSTLLRSAGPHRVSHSGVDLDVLATHYEDRVVERIQAAGGAPGCGAVLVSALPMCSIVGTDYERLITQVSRRLTPPVLLVPPNSLTDDWLGGYAATLQALAQGLDLSGGAPRDKNVAVVGYFMDRNEGDHQGNLAVLHTMLRALDLEPVSIWPSGGGVEQLREVRHAATIISLPHGREAAATLAQRLDAHLVELDLPFGLADTAAWLRGAGLATGREAQAETTIEQQLERVVGRLQWMIPQAFLNRRFGYVGDPHYAVPLAHLLEEVGGELSAAVLTGRRDHMGQAASEELARYCAASFEPRVSQFGLGWPDADPGALDLIICGSEAVETFGLQDPWLEWGYPSHFHHVLADEPFLGFDGALRFLGRVGNVIVREASGRTLARRKVARAPEDVNPGPDHPSGEPDPAVSHVLQANLAMAEHLFSYPPSVVLEGSIAPLPTGMIRPIVGDALLYAHVPFCQSICKFCNVYKELHPGKSSVSTYIEALLTEARAVAAQIQGTRFVSAYVGGGTPTVLSADQLDLLLGSLREIFALTAGIPFELDATPSTITREKVDVMLRQGVRYLSMGVQTLEDSVLESIGRRRQNDLLSDAARILKDTGLQLHFDFVVGLPGEDLTALQTHIDRVVEAFAPSSLSINTYEQTADTAFAQEGFERCSPGSAQGRGVRQAKQALQRYVLERYDLRRGPVHYFPRVWDGSGVVGVGAGAYGYMPGAVAYRNLPYADYLRCGHDTKKFYPLDPDEDRRSFIVHNLGHPKLFEAYAERFASALSDDFPAEIQALDSLGLLDPDRQRILLKTSDAARGVAVRFYSPKVMASYAR